MAQRSNQLVQLIRLGMEHLASCPRAKVYCATNRGNPHLAPVKMIDTKSVRDKVPLTPWSMYNNTTQEKPFAEAAVGAPSRPLKSTLRLGFARDSCAAVKVEHEQYRI